MSLPRFVSLPNGDKVKPTFSEPEMMRRLDGLRQTMEAMDLDWVLFTSMHNIHYYSDFLYCSFGRPYGLVVDGQRSVSVSANIDGGQPYRRTFGENLVYTDWQQDSYYHAVKTLLGSVGRLGVEFDHLTLAAQNKLTAVLPGIELVDIAPATMRQRMIKSEEEIALIREGARIADVGGWACIEAIAEGVPEYEVSAHATTSMVREIARSYPDSEIRDTWVWFQSGLNTDGVHNPLTTRCIGKGDILSLNCFPMIAGYYTALERTLFFASATERELALWEINCQVHRRGLELIRPGARCCDIAQELNEIYLSHDLLPVSYTHLRAHETF